MQKVNLNIFSLKIQFLLISILLNSFNSYCQVPTSERDALIAFYYATDGDNWDHNMHWNTADPVSTWQGLKVENISGQDHVTEIILQFNYLNGSIPASLTNLTKLKKLDLSHNNINGVFPDLTGINSLTYLRIALNDLHFNGFENQFNAYKTNLDTFVYSPMNIVGNRIDDDVVIGNYYTMIMPFIEGTGVTYQWYKNEMTLSGETNRMFTINNAQLSDAANYTCKASSAIITDLTIDRAIIYLYGKVSTIQKDALIALYNATDGANWSYEKNWNTSEPVHNWSGITVIGNDVSEISLIDNNLSGSLPSEIENLTQLKHLDLAGNKLSGTIPSSIGNLSHIEYLNLCCNELTGTIPPEIGNCDNLKTLDLEVNRLTGNIPLSFTNLTKIIGFWINENQLSGVIPDYFSNWLDLHFFSIGRNFSTSGLYNNFTGILDLSNNTKLVLCWINANDFSIVKVNNGNNDNFWGSDFFDSRNNPNLTCVFVDDTVWSKENWTFVDSTTNFVETETECEKLNPNEENQNKDICIYPNPANTIFNIAITENDNINSISLINSIGEVIKEVKSTNSIDISSLPNGLYFVKIERQNDEDLTLKLLKI